MEKLIWISYSKRHLLGGTAIMKGFKAKVDRPVKPEKEQENEDQ